MNPPARLSNRYALHAMNATFKLQVAVSTIAADLEDDLLEAADPGLVTGEDLDLPVFPLGVERIHPEEVGGKERGLVATGPGPDLDDDVLLVHRILRDQQHPDLAQH